MKIVTNNINFIQKVYIKKTVRKALDLLGQTNQVQVEITFADADYMQQLNSTYRDVHRSTDVLSFPMLELVAGEIVTKDKFVGDTDYKTGLVMLGEIYIDYVIAAAQAKEFNHSIKREICFLVLHGLLHLLGYDHNKQEDEQIMIELQQSILNKIGIIR